MVLTLGRSKIDENTFHNDIRPWEFSESLLNTWFMMRICMHYYRNIYPKHYTRVHFIQKYRKLFLKFSKFIKMVIGIMSPWFRTSWTETFSLKGWNSIFNRDQGFGSFTTFDCRIIWTMLYQEPYHIISQMKLSCKEGCVFSMVISSKFRMGQYRDDDHRRLVHREDAPHFIR